METAAKLGALQTPTAFAAGVLWKWGVLIPLATAGYHGRLHVTTTTPKSPRLRASCNAAASA